MLPRQTEAAGQPPRRAPASEGRRQKSPRPGLDLDSVFRAHAQTVARFAARLAGPGFDVDDLVQEVFLVVRDKLHRFHGGTALTTWLYGITYNVVRHHRRRHRWRRWLTGSAVETAGDLEATGPTPLEQLEQKQALHHVYRILEGLTEKQRTVFILFELERLSGEEVARLTGTRLATVWVQLHRARAEFFRRLEALGLREEWAGRDDATSGARATTAEGRSRLKSRGGP